MAKAEVTGEAESEELKGSRNGSVGFMTIYGWKYFVLICIYR